MTEPSHTDPSPKASKGGARRKRETSYQVYQRIAAKKSNQASEPKNRGSSTASFVATVGEMAKNHKAYHLLVLADDNLDRE